MTGQDERRTLSLQPSKSISAVGVFVLVFMFVFGVGFTIVVANVLYENDAPLGLAVLFFIFMIGWLGIAAFMLFYNFRNLREAKGVPIIEIDLTKDEPDGAREEGRTSRTQRL